MPDGQVVGTALTAAIGSLLILSALFLVWRQCGPGRSYLKKGSNDDYLVQPGESAGKKKKKKAPDEEAGMVLPELDAEGRRVEMAEGGKKDEL